MTDTDPRRAYIVTQTIRGTQTFFIRADSVADARRRFDAGEAEPIDNQVHGGALRFTRSPGDERD